MVSNHILNILRLLIDKPDDDLTIRKLSLIEGINYKSAYEIVKKLLKNGDVIIKKVGNSSVVKFSGKFDALVFQVEEKKRLELLKDKNVKVFYNRICRVENPFFIALVFGSYAKKTCTKNSDLDLCIIADKPSLNEKIQDIIRTTPLNIDFYGFSPQEFINMLRSRRFNVAEEIVKHRIILKGAEEFYQLIKDLR